MRARGGGPQKRYRFLFSKERGSLTQSKHISPKDPMSQGTSLNDELANNARGLLPVPVPDPPALLKEIDLPASLKPRSTQG